MFRPTKHTTALATEFTCSEFLGFACFGVLYFSTDIKFFEVKVEPILKPVYYNYIYAKAGFYTC